TSRSTTSRKIKKLGYTRKRLKLIVSARNSERVISKRYIFGLALSSVADNQLVFIDETCLNLHYSFHYGYSPAGTNACMNVPTQQGRNPSVIASISTAGILSYKIVSGGFNAVLMEEWCRTALCLSMVGTPVYILDNAIFHHFEIVRVV
ncbi:hypothetical protein CDIK_3255, partial [Cucumispora dikerogammari]